MKAKKINKSDAAGRVRCSECGKEVPNTNALDDCFECNNVTDACESCIEDHMAEQHDDEVDD